MFILQCKDIYINTFKIISRFDKISQYSIFCFMIYWAGSSAAKIHVQFAIILSFDQESVVCRRHRRRRGHHKLAAVHHARYHGPVSFPITNDSHLQEMLIPNRHNFQHIFLLVLQSDLLEHLKRIRFMQNGRHFLGNKRPQCRNSRQKKIVSRLMEKNKIIACQ